MVYIYSNMNYIDPDTQELITETLDDFFKENLNNISNDICPHCKHEILENHVFSDDGGKTLKHTDCNTELLQEDFPDKIPTWILPFFDSALKEHLNSEYPQDKEMMNLSGEAKYYKNDKPGGVMDATISYEGKNNDFKSNTSTEEVNIDSIDFSKLFDDSIRIVNTTNLPLKFKIDRINVDTADAYIIKVSNA